jgi:hypothetical protein
MKSTEFLQAAIDVQAERGKQYDKPSGERSMGATISAFNCITGYTLEESDGWMLLGLLKLVRQSQNPEQYHHDSALDFVAYASLYAESASEQCGQLEAEQPSHIISDIPRIEIPDWRNAPEWANWLAQDKGGAWYWYQYPVVIDGGWWVEREGYDGNVEQAACSGKLLDWESTLQSRPARTAQ